MMRQWRCVAALMVELRRATRHIAAPHDLLVTSKADLERNAELPGSTEYEPAQFGVSVYAGAMPSEEATPAQRWFALALQDLVAGRILLRTVRQPCASWASSPSRRSRRR